MGVAPLPMLLYRDVMRFPVPLISGTLVKRYKRFLADITLDNGEEITAHCANPGAMLGLDAPGSRVFLSISDNPKRKLRHSWELVETDLGRGPALVGINTSQPNGLVAEAIAADAIPPLTGYERLRREVRYGKNSRIDILLESDQRPLCYVEIKNVHLMRQAGLAEFPDCVTARGAKHLVELGDMAEAGHRAVMVYLVQRPDASRFKLAADMDPNYAAAFALARQRGVEAIAVDCSVTPEEIKVRNLLPLG